MLNCYTLFTLLTYVTIVTGVERDIPGDGDWTYFVILVYLEDTDSKR